MTQWIRSQKYQKNFVFQSNNVYFPINSLSGKFCLRLYGKGEYFPNDMETTIKLKVAELGPAVIEAVKLLAQGSPEAEVTISVRLARPAAPVAQSLHQASATPGGFSANYLAGSADEDDDLSDPFGDMTKILK
jgi:hypothetical protein